MELQYNLLADDPCNAVSTPYLVDELSLLNSRLSYLEQLYGKKDSELIQLKQYYSILQIRHWMLFKKAQGSCNQTNDLVLYFYSNEGCDDCEVQGSVLSAFRKKYPDDVKVYAFDMDLQDPALITLKDMYGVAIAPTIIYNDVAFPGSVSFPLLEAMKLNMSIASEILEVDLDNASE